MAFDTDPLVIVLAAFDPARYGAMPLITGTGAAPVLSAQVPTPNSTGHLPTVVISFEVD